MPDVISLAIAIPVALALLAGMGILWKRIQNLEKKVDSLQSARLADQKSYSEAYLTAIQGILKSNSDLSKTLEKLIDRIEVQTDLLRKCNVRNGSGHHPPQESAGDTTALMHKNSKGQSHG